MLSWALTFLVLAIVAGLFGFGVIATASVQIAQFLFVIFVGLFVLSLVLRVLRAPPAV
jgi:uncharacterized membrane protein YtjA (UPF0391 family)